jgi:hypothetical protein
MGTETGSTRKGVVTPTYTYEREIWYDKLTEPGNGPGKLSRYGNYARS